MAATDIWSQNQTLRTSVVSISLCLSWSFCLLLINVFSFSFFSSIYNRFSPLILLCTNLSCHFHCISLFSFFLIFLSPSHAYFLSSPTSLSTPMFSSFWVCDVLPPISLGSLPPQPLFSSPSSIWRRQWHSTPVLLPGKSHGWRSLVGCHLWGRTESDTTERLHFHALEKAMATHSSVLAWRIPGRGEPGGLPSMGSHRVRHDWSDLVPLF